ncbi:MAG: type 1 glutamine amidotransferase [Armatimonadetes bacterium]|nr:type 1 glutamine amidotransferase [Armatimonadota bacterium]
MEYAGKTVAVLVEDQYQDLEVWYPILRLREAGARVITVGTGKKMYRSKHGYEVEANVDASAVDPDAIDGVVVPGGYAPDLLRRYPAVVNLVRDVFHQGKLVAAICHGPWVLVSAGVLKGRRSTCFFAIKDDVINAGSSYQDAEVLVDGNLVTSRKPDDLPAFMREVLKALVRQPETVAAGKTRGET